ERGGRVALEIGDHQAVGLATALTGFAGTLGDTPASAELLTRWARAGAGRTAGTGRARVTTGTAVGVAGLGVHATCTAVFLTFGALAGAGHAGSTTRAGVAT